MLLVFLKNNYCLRKPDRQIVGKLGKFFLLKLGLTLKQIESPKNLVFPGPSKAKYGPGVVRIFRMFLPFHVIMRLNILNFYISKF